MGLHKTAHYLKSKGRGNDTMLVHMTPGEVKGLQSLAMSAGGSLTINPDTGLPEAGFLEQILPVVAAAGLTYLTAGAATPTLAAALGTTGGGIAAGALSGAAISGGMAAIQGKDVGQAALMGGLGGGIAGGMGAYADANVFNAPNLLADASQKAVTDAGTQAVAQGGTQALGSAATPPTSVNAAGYNISMPNPSAPGTFINPEIGPVGGAITEPLYPNATQAGINAANMAPGEAQRAALNQLSQNTNTLAEGSKQLAGQPTFYQGLEPYGVGRAAVQSLPVLGLLEDKQQVGPQDNYQSPLRRISSDFRAYEPPRPNPYYSARYAAEGGIMQSYQAGGPVERMSMMNTAMNPQGGLYPQGMIDKTQYAVPTQRPVSSELMMETPAYERSSPMLMASGGQVKGYAAGGVPDFDLQNHMAPQAIPMGNFDSNRVKVLPDLGPGHKWNIESYQGTREEENAAMAANQAAGIKTTGGLSSMLNQSTGQSMFPGAASMQGGFGQGAQGYPSFAMGSGGSDGGSGGPFPLEGQYGIVRMNTGGTARLPKGDPGLYRDADPTTRGQDAFTAALTRLNSMQKKANIKGLPALKAVAQPLGNIQEAAKGGVMSSLGGYSDGGRMLKGPGDGMSDSIPASIANKQPARLADGEFVVPADVVSHLGNGSTDAGARKLYAMMDKIRKARTGKKKQAPAVKADRYMPA
jgi:hypothetical protein